MSFCVNHHVLHKEQSPVRLGNCTNLLAEGYKLTRQLDTMSTWQNNHNRYSPGVFVFSNNKNSSLFGYIYHTIHVFSTVEQT